MNYYPERIVCLTEETTETFYLLGEEDRIVGISGFTVRPAIARKEKPKVSTFLDANIEEIIDLKPDLVIGFSDIQSNIAKELIEKGITVWINNHRTVDEIFKMMVQLGALVGRQEKAIKLVQGYQKRMDEIKQITTQWNIKPKVYFEEWYDPIISGISWVSELVELAGGQDVFQDLSRHSLAKDRIIENDQEIVAKNPDIILASWCGKKFKLKRMMKRENWSTITASQRKDIYEIDSSIILQPGPAAVGEGIEIMHQFFSEWVQKQS